jgi:DNA-binding beta-propeller fold protein YncE
MGVDDRLSDALQHVGDRVRPDVPAALRAVRTSGVRRRRRRRWSLVAVTVLAVLAALLVGNAIRSGERHPPMPAKRVVQSNPFTVVHTFTAASLGLEHLLAVAAAPDGNLYVTDSSQTVAEVTPDGQVLRRWGAPGSTAGHFRLDVGSVAVDRRGRVYVSDTGNFRVQVFTGTGRFLRSIGRFGHAEGEFLWPFDIAVDDRGAVYVADDRAETLTKLSSVGRPLWRVGGPHERVPLLVGHEHFQGFDAGGRLVTTNDDRGRVLFIAPDGTVDAKYGTFSSGEHESERLSGRGVFPDGACDASVDPQGRVYVTSCQDRTQPGHTTTVLDDSGHVTGVWRRNVLARSPVFVDRHTAFGVTYDGSLVRLAVAD